MRKKFFLLGSRINRLQSLYSHAARSRQRFFLSLLLANRTELTDQKLLPHSSKQAEKILFCWSAELTSQNHCPFVQLKAGRKNYLFIGRPNQPVKILSSRTAPTKSGKEKKIVGQNWSITVFVLTYSSNKAGGGGISFFKLASKRLNNHNHCPHLQLQQSRGERFFFIGQHN